MRNLIIMSFLEDLETQKLSFLLASTMACYQKLNSDYKENSEFTTTKFRISHPLKRRNLT